MLIKKESRLTKKTVSLPMSREDIARLENVKAEAKKLGWEFAPEPTLARQLLTQITRAEKDIEAEKKLRKKPVVELVEKQDEMSFDHGSSFS